MSRVPGRRAIDVSTTVVVRESTKRTIAVLRKKRFRRRLCARTAETTTTERLTRAAVVWTVTDGPVAPSVAASDPANGSRAETVRGAARPNVARPEVGKRTDAISCDRTTISSRPSLGGGSRRRLRGPLRAIIGRGPRYGFEGKENTEMRLPARGTYAGGTRYNCCIASVDALRCAFVIIVAGDCNWP